MDLLQKAMTDEIFRLSPTKTLAQDHLDHVIAAMQATLDERYDEWCGRRNYPAPGC